MKLDLCGSMLNIWKEEILNDLNPMFSIILKSPILITFST
jgi:hypothetical protein